MSLDKSYDLDKSYGDVCESGSWFPFDAKHATPRPRRIFWRSWRALVK